MERNIKFYGFVFLFSGMLLLLRSYLILSFEIESLGGAVMTVCGLRLFYMSYGSDKKLNLLFAIFLFFFGILFFISSEYNLQMDASLILTTVFLSFAVLFLFAEPKSLGPIVLSLGLFSCTILYFLFGIRILNFELLPYPINSTEFLISLSIICLLSGFTILIKLWRKKAA